MRRRSRKTPDLIEDLHAPTGTQYLDVALLVPTYDGRFPREWTFIKRSEGSKDIQLEKLNAALLAGGTPVALLGVEAAGNLTVWPLKEYETDQRINEMLRILMNMLKDFENQGADYRKLPDSLSLGMDSEVM